MIERPPPVPTTYRGAGVYVFRTRRPGVIGRIPFWIPLVACAMSFWATLLLGYPTWPALLALLLYPRHFAYVGETVAMDLRRSEHVDGGGRFKAVAKPWADLDPRHFHVRLPARKWLLHSVETLGIMLFWPVYNQQKNLWNPRRIPLASARKQRARRDSWGWSFNMRPIHLAVILALLITFGVHL